MNLWGDIIQLLTGGDPGSMARGSKVRLGREDVNRGCIDEQACIVGDWGTGHQRTSGRVPRVHHRIVPPKGKKSTPTDSTLVNSSLLEAFSPWHSQAECSRMTGEHL